MELQRNVGGLAATLNHTCTNVDNLRIDVKTQGEKIDKMRLWVARVIGGAIVLGFIFWLIPATVREHLWSSAKRCVSASGGRVLSRPTQISSAAAFRVLTDLIRKRAKRVGILDDLNLNYFSTAATPPRQADGEMPPGAIFISYAREDRAAASGLCDFLEKEAGIYVWLDSRQLSTGEDWYDGSHRYIDNCSYFLPLISADALRRQDGLFRRQWAWATERARGFGPSHPFIVPVVIDDTPGSADGIPEEFQRVEWARLRGGVGNEAFLHDMIALVREYRNRGRGQPLGSGKE
jgi:hypothetical protein